MMSCSSPDHVRWGSSWARLNKTRSIETAMLIRRRQIMFWKLFDVFAHLMKTRELIQVQITVGIAPSLRLLEGPSNDQVG